MVAFVNFLINERDDEEIVAATKETRLVECNSPTFRL